MTKELSLYQLNQEINDAVSLQKMISSEKSKYNNPLWKLYCNKLDPQPIRQWRRFIDEDEIAVKASMVSINSPLPVRSIAGGKELYGSIGRLGHAFTMDAKDIDEINSEGYRGGDIVTHYIKKVRNKITTEIIGVHNAINDMVLQGISKGKMVIDKNNNPDGISFEYDFKVPSANKLCCKHASKTWVDDDYSPLEDLKRMLQVAKKEGIVVSHFEMTQEKFDRLTTHPLTIAAFRGLVGLDATTNLTAFGNNAIWEKIRSALSFPKVLIIDEISMIEIDGVPTQNSASFEASNVVLRGEGAFFDLLNSPPLAIYDANPAVVTTSIENKFIVIQKSFASQPVGEHYSVEAQAMPVPKNPKNVIILNTGKANATGTGI